MARASQDPVVRSMMDDMTAVLEYGMFALDKSTSIGLVDAFGQYTDGSHTAAQIVQVSACVV